MTQEKFIQTGNTKLIIMQSCFTDNPLYQEFDGFISACSEIEDTGDGVYYERTKADTTEELIEILEKDNYMVIPLYRWLDFNDNFAGLLICQIDVEASYKISSKFIYFCHKWQAYLNSHIYTVEIMVDNETVTTWRGIYGLYGLKEFLKCVANLSISDDELLTKINTDY